VKKLLVLVAFLSVSHLHATDKLMIDAIERVQPDKLNQLFFPGFFTSLKDQEAYLAAAQAATNKTYKQLHVYRAMDLINGVKALTKLGISGLGAAAAFLYYQGNWDVSLWNIDADPRTIVAQDLLRKSYRGAVYGALGFFSWCMLKGGLEDISSIVHKTDQWQRHREALANEAVIMRIPVCGTNGCIES